MVAASTPSPVIQFTSIDALFEEIVDMMDQATGDILIVRGISAQKFVEFEAERQKRRRKFRVRRFSAESKLLIITIPTDLHEQLHLWLRDEAWCSLSRMGLHDGWRMMGSATRRAGEDSGEGDSTGGPWSQRDSEEPGQPLFIHAGDSETLDELRNDMRWWFSAADHQVKIVLLAKFDHSLNKIILAGWVEVQAPPLPGATTTRASAAQAASQFVPDRSQVITITRDPGTDPASYTVTEDLRLEFDRLFLRQPGEGEGDVIICVQDLQEYANAVWSQV